jgi:hypothetical protein
VLTAGFVMLFIDRHYGGGFFEPALGGNPVLWQHVFWFFGHPEVYILILPAFGIVTEILPVFSRKPLFGYKAFVFATASIGALGFTVWAHHMFTTGAVFLPYFSFFTFLIAVPTGIKFFNWLATMWGGQLRFATPLLFALGFISLFLIGGLDGAFLAVVPFDFHVQDTYWVVSHLHYVLVAGSVFGIFAALYYWFPKMSGRYLNERLGKVHFVLLFIGTNLAFFPQHLLGLDGMPPPHRPLRRQPGLGLAQPALDYRRFHHRHQHAAVPVESVHHAAQPAQRAGRRMGRQHARVGDTSPPPTYNFDSLPPIHSERPLFDLKHGPVVAHALALPAGPVRRTTNCARTPRTWWPGIPASPNTPRPRTPSQLLPSPSPPRPKRPLRNPAERSRQVTVRQRRPGRAARRGRPAWRSGADRGWRQHRPAGHVALHRQRAHVLCRPVRRLLQRPIGRAGMAAGRCRLHQPHPAAADRDGHPDHQLDHHARLASGAFARATAQA